MRTLALRTRPVAVQVAAIGVGLVLSALLATIVHVSPTRALSTLFEGSFGTDFALTQTVLRAVPLALAGLAVALPLRMNLWNIGAEGQFHAGAIGATWVALTFDGWSSGALLPAMVIGAVAAGAIWALVAAVPRAIWGVNEIITTLLLNYIAILAVAYLVTGPWRSAQRFPQTDLFTAAAVLPRLGSSLVHIGVFFPLAAAAVLVFFLARSKWGFEVRLIGANPEAARLAGISIARNIVVVMLVAGALAGVAGMVEVSVTFGRLQNGISPGYGYMAIVIAALGRANLAATLLIAVLFGGFVIGGYALQTLGIPAAFVLLMQGTILFSALAGARLAGYRLGSWLPTRLRARWLAKEEPSIP